MVFNNKLRKKTKKINSKSIDILAKVSALLLGAMAILVLVIGKAKLVSVGVSILARDDAASKISESNVISPALHRLFSVDLVYMFAAFLIVMALYRLALIVRLNSRYANDIHQGDLRFKWVEFGVFQVFALTIVNLLGGAREVSHLLFIVMAGLIMVISGNSINESIKAKSLLAKNKVVLAVSFFGAWLMMGLSLLGSSTLGAGSISLGTELLIVGLFLSSFALIALNYARSINAGRVRDYSVEKSEILVLSFSTFVYLLFSGYVLAAILK